MSFHSDTFSCWGKFPGVNFPGEILCWGFDKIPTWNSFYLCYFLFAESVLHVEMLWSIVHRKFSPGQNYLKDLGEIFTGNFFTRGGFPIWFGKHSEIKVLLKWKCAKKTFSAGIVRKKFSRRNFQWEGNCLGKSFWRWGGVLRGSNFHEGIFCGAKEFFTEKKPDFPVLF